MDSGVDTTLTNPPGTSKMRRIDDLPTAADSAAGANRASTPSHPPVIDITGFADEYQLALLLNANEYPALPDGEPAHVRWYNVVAGIEIGAIQGWNEVSDMTQKVPMNKQHRCLDKATAVARFLADAQKRIWTVRSRTGLVHNIPGISNIDELRAWVEGGAQVRHG
ncbi:hypothetical protein NMY22_g17496 [Coprinellus aureogranulatus]|nr:hypothetical protein NMY22_g17496 [Coprinellus aureogranulatus]